MPNPPRKHHFVQAEHIRQFRDADGIVWVFAKDGKEFHATPKGIFKKKDLNSFNTPAGIDTSFEEYVTGVENDCWPAIKRTIALEKIAPADIPNITAYLAFSRVRNPTVQRGIIDFKRQYLEDTARLIDQNGQFDKFGPWPLEPERSVTELLQDGSLTFSISNTEYLRAILQMVEPFQKILANGYEWCLIKSPRDRVILSDHPLTFLHPGEHPGAYGITPGGKTCEVAFPLSKRIYLLGLWKREHGDFESEDAVDELNRRQAIFASRHIASCSRRKWVRHLACRYRNWGFQTIASRIGPLGESNHILRAGVYQLPGTPKHEGAHPLEHTKPVVKMYPLQA